MTLAAKIFVINLSQRVDRRRRMTRLLRDRPKDIALEFVRAVDGNDVDRAYLRERGYGVLGTWKRPRSRNHYYARELKRGELACGLSHLSVWESIRDEGPARAIVFEDDLKIGRGFWQQLDAAIGALDQRAPRWEFFYLRRRLQTEDRRRVAPGIVVPGYSYSTAAYVLTPSGAARLADGGYKNRLIPIDEYIPALYCRHPRADVRALFGTGPRLRAYAPEKNLVHVHVNDPSDIESSSDWVGA